MPTLKNASALEIEAATTSICGYEPNHYTKKATKFVFFCKNVYFCKLVVCDAIQVERM